MNKPLISIVLPVYNAAEFLSECLQSISLQTFSDWELIAIDDGSTDSSLSVLKNFAQIEKRMRVITRENRGLVHTLNEGVSLAEGDWIARMDADDVCLPDRFENQLNWANKHKADLCGGQILRIGVPGKHSWIFPSSNDGIVAWMLFRSAFAHPTVMLRRELALRFPYDPDYSHSNQDFDLWTRLALSSITMTNYPCPVLQYRIHEKQVSQARREGQINLRVQICKRYWENNSLCKGLTFIPCLVDERLSVSKSDFLDGMRILSAIDERLSDHEALAAINHHRIWFIYRAVNLGGRTLIPALKKTRMSIVKKAAVAILAIFRAGWLIDYCKNAEWIRFLPLKWFF